MRSVHHRRMSEYSKHEARIRLDEYMETYGSTNRIFGFDRIKMPFTAEHFYVAVIHDNQPCCKIDCGSKEPVLDSPAVSILFSSGSMLNLYISKYIPAASLVDATPAHMVPTLTQSIDFIQEVGYIPWFVRTGPHPTQKLLCTANRPVLQVQ